MAICNSIRFVPQFKDEKYCFLGIICIVIQLVTFWVDTEEQAMLSYLRHDFIGWFPLFALGIVYYRNHQKVGFIPTIADNFLLNILGIFVFVVFIIASQLNFIFGLFAPFFAILLYFSLTKVIAANNMFKVIFIWIGKYSAFIFVIHPMARAIVRRLLEGHSLILILIIYVATTLLFSMLYEKMSDCLKVKMEA